MTVTDLYREHAVVSEALHYLHYSPRNRAALLSSWIIRLGGAANSASAYPYLLESVSDFLGVLPECTAIGMEPPMLDRFAESLEVGRRLLTDAFDKAAWRRAEEHIAGLRRRLEAWVGGTRGDDPAPDPLTRAAAGDVVIPVIEQDMTGGKLPFFTAFGGIARLHVEVSASSEGPDRITLSRHHLAGSFSAIDAELENSLYAARTTVPFVHPKIRVRPFHARVTFDEQTAAYAGRSLGLAVTVALLAELSRMYGERTYYAVRPGVLVTGRVAMDGSVLPLDDEQVRRKLRLAFFSPFDVLVFPKGNESAVQAEYDELRAVHPGRTQVLLPVRTVAEVFNNRLAVETVIRTVRERATRWFRRRQLPITVGTFALGIAALAALLLTMDFDDNPSRVVTRENTFFVQNARGKLLWTAPISVPERPAAIDGAARRPLNQLTISAIIDLDEDGSNEVILGHPMEYAGFSDSITCHRADGTVYWTAPLGRPTVTRENDYRNSTFRTLAVWAGRLVKNGPPRVIVVSNNSAYSCVVTLFDARGRELSSYLHTGSLYEIVVHPRPRSDSSDILLFGTHNGFKQAVAVVLDPGTMSGVGPEEETHRFLEPVLPRARERAYLLFPRSDVGKIARNRPTPEAAFFSFDHDRILLKVIEAEVPKDMSAASREFAELIYSLNSRYLPVGVHSSSHFDLLREHYMKAGLLSSPFDERYRQSLLDSILIMTDRGFVSWGALRRSGKISLDAR